MVSGLMEARPEGQERADGARYPSRCLLRRPKQPNSVIGSAFTLLGGMASIDLWPDH